MSSSRWSMRKWDLQEFWNVPNKLRWLSFNSSTRAESAKAASTAITHYLQNNDYKRLRPYFPPLIRWFVSEKSLQKLWRFVVRQTGPIESFEQPIIDSTGVITKSKVLIQFQHVRQALILYLDPWNHMISLNLTEPAKVGLAPPWSPPAYVDVAAFTEEEISLKVGWWPAVKGTLTLPKKTGPHPVVIMLVGSGPCDRDINVGPNKPFRDVAWGLGSKGIAAFRMDKPLLALMVKLFITRNATLEDEYLYHADAAIAMLRRRAEIDPSRIFVLGASLGGGVAPRVCARNPDTVAGMISCAGYAQPLMYTAVRQQKWVHKHFPRAEAEDEEEMKRLMEQAAVIQSPDFSRKTPVSKMPLRIPPSYWLDLKEHDPVEVAKGIRTPILLLQGDADWQVTVEDDLQRWRDGLEGSKERVTEKVYEGVNHLFMREPPGVKGPRQYYVPGHVEQKVVDDIAGWIESH